MQPLRKEDADINRPANEDNSALSAVNIAPATRELQSQIETALQLGDQQDWRARLNKLHAIVDFIYDNRNQNIDLSPALEVALRLVNLLLELYSDNPRNYDLLFSEKQKLLAAQSVIGQVERPDAPRVHFVESERNEQTDYRSRQLFTTLADGSTVSGIALDNSDTVPGVVAYFDKLVARLNSGKLHDLRQIQEAIYDAFQEPITNYMFVPTWSFVLCYRSKDGRTCSVTKIQQNKPIIEQSPMENLTRNFHVYCNGSSQEVAFGKPHLTSEQKSPKQLYVWYSQIAEPVELFRIVENTLSQPLGSQKNLETTLTIDF